MASSAYFLQPEPEKAIAEDADHFLPLLSLMSAAVTSMLRTIMSMEGHRRPGVSNSMISNLELSRTADHHASEDLDEDPKHSTVRKAA